MNVQAVCNHTVFLTLLAGAALGCSSEKTAQAATKSSGNASVVGQAAAPTSAAGTALQFVLAPDGNAARYRVREKLVGHDLPNDAIGETKNVSGTIAFDSSGKVIREASKFTVDAGTFVSDKDRRDGYVRKRLLESDQYPQVVLAPTEVRGVSLPLPASGSRPFELLGDLTVRGVTRPTVWKGTVQLDNGHVTGNAATQFTFVDIQMDQPRVPVLLSVADTIRLEIDFNLVRK